MVYLVRLWHKTRRHWARIPARSDVCYRGCTYTVLQTVHRPGVLSMLCTFKNSCSHSIRVEHSLDFRLLSVVQYCSK